DFLGGCVFTPPVSGEIIGAEFLRSEIERRIIPLLRKSAASETISPSFPPRPRNAGFRLGNESRTAPEYTLSSELLLLLRKRNWSQHFARRWLRILDCENFAAPCGRRSPLPAE